MISHEWMCMDSDVHLTCGNGLVNAMISLKLFEQVQFVKDFMCLS